MKKQTVIATACLVGLLGLWYAGPWIYGHMGGRYEASRRGIFEESKAYQHGVVEQLERLKLDYELADNEHHRSALMATAKSTAANATELPPHLAAWLGR